MEQHLSSFLESWFSDTSNQLWGRWPAPSCCVYIRPDGILVFPEENRGGATVMVGPVARLATDADATFIGAAVAQAIMRFKMMPTPPKDPWHSDAATLAGFTSFGELARSAALLNVEGSTSEITVEPMAAKGGGYEPVDEASGQCKPDAAAIGELILHLAKHCVVRGRLKVQRPLHSPQRAVQNDDPPQSFGYKICWLAVSSADGESAANALGLRNLRPMPWTKGLERAYEHQGVFVTPPIEGWTLMVGRIPEAGEEAFLPTLEKLSHQFGDAMYFGTHRVVEYQAWAHARAGAVLRAFAYLGESGEFLLNFGPRTPAEIELETGSEDLDQAPDEEAVMNIASAWLLDPRELSQAENANGPGWFGNL